MNYNDIIVFDFETTGKHPETAQIVQIGAVAIHGRKLEIKAGSEFNCLVKPLYGEECAKAGLQELGDEAIKIHGKTHEMLKDAMSVKSGLENFKEYVDSHNYKKTSWTAPIPFGYNSVGYDHPILDRELQSNNIDYFFHPIYKLDALHFMWAFFENDKDIRSLSGDNLIRGHMGYSKGEAHDALSDVIMTAEVICKTLHLIRTTSSKIKFKGCFNV